MEINDFWEEAHQKNEELWLTGSYFGEVWGSLDIVSKFLPGITVLNIGVGLGRDTQELSSKGAVVDVLDISQTALNRVKDITRNQYLSSNLGTLPINEYDIAVSHLVTQHMNDEDLAKQIRYVTRSLKSTGIFAMQFAFINDTPEDKNSYDLVYGSIMDRPPEQRGHMFRTLDQMKHIVETVCDGKISWVSDIRTYEHTPIKWYYIHIKKN
jgi:SAM-dependent methyltransferase